MKSIWPASKNEVKYSLYYVLGTYSVIWKKIWSKPEEAIWIRKTMIILDMYDPLIIFTASMPCVDQPPLGSTTRLCHALPMLDQNYYREPEDRNLNWLVTEYTVAKVHTKIGFYVRSKKFGNIHWQQKNHGTN